MGAGQSVVWVRTTVLVTPATYSRAQRHAIAQAESDFRDQLLRRSRFVAVAGLVLTARLLLEPRIRWLGLLAAWATAAVVFIDGAVFLISKKANPDERHQVQPLFSPFIWAEYTTADGPPALPAVRAPTLRWWGRW